MTVAGPAGAGEISEPAILHSGYSNCLRWLSWQPAAT